MLKRIPAILYIQVDYRRMMIEEYWRCRKAVIRSLREFYEYQNKGYWQSMCFRAELVFEGLSDMNRINRKLTMMFITIHCKKLTDPIAGFYSGKYDLLRERD